MSGKHSTNEKSKTKISSSPSNPNDEPRYCICQKREDELNDDDNDFMIECDGCNGWFHGKCVGLADRVADDIEKYFCPECSKQHGSSIFKQRKNQHRRDYSDPDAQNKPVQSGTPAFIGKLKRKIFPSCDPVITRLKGNQITVEYLEKNGFTKPILITNRDGLDMKLPSRTITLSDIGDLVGHDRFIDIIDCEKQATYKMSFSDYIEYFENFDRTKIYNVLSLEISNTKLGEQVVTPKIVRDLSWSTIGIWPIKNANEEENDANGIATKNTWPLQTAVSKKKRRVVSSTDTDQSDDEHFEHMDADHFENFERPEVAKYCLMSPQSSYTDFHVDFGGSSVWYSVVRGEKIFYLIEPTDENLQKYAEWSGSSTESEVFLGDCVSHCYKMHLREENTVLIPPGWIHAVYTVTDSLVFGGNFLQTMGVDMQLRIYELERLAQVPNKFLFPLFETFHWYAAKTFYDELKECNESSSITISPVTQQACESMLHYMSKWLSNDKRYHIRNRSIVPKGILCEKLLRDLARELDLAKARCGSSAMSKPPSKSILASPVKLVLPMEPKQELIHMNNTKKIKVKCRRLSSETGSTKNKDSSNNPKMKLTIKTTLSGCRKPTNSRDSTNSTNKKKTGRPVKQQKNANTTNDPIKQEEPPKITYTLDLEAKRQRFIEPANNQSIHEQLDKNSSSSNDGNTSSILDASNTDISEIHDINDSLGGIADGGLASFVKTSSMNDDYYHPNKESKLKREHSSSDKKTPTKKSKTKSSTDTEKKSTKKIKSEDSTVSNNNRKKSSSTTPTTPTTPTPLPKTPSSTHNTPQPLSTNKKRLTSSTPKKLNPKDRLGKILKIANTIKSRGGVLT